MIGPYKPNSQIDSSDSKKGENAAIRHLSEAIFDVLSSPQEIIATQPHGNRTPN